ncbi:aquaporin-like protein [Schizopora paradoxa]|uniref:Aquaporin-like protein n=1 Tax=Schizopora paradoxa TaxID=27342 RepID=A0A0H2RZL6_9AGAM|nr:aquaporin-like protein [Schizopora paradoxa]
MHDTEPRFLHISDIQKRPAFLTAWERHRHGAAHWIVECVSEFVGVFFYVYMGVGSTASMVIGGLTDQPALGSLLQVGFAYAIGIVLALTIAAPTSGGHLNPCVTIAFALYRGFPWRKVPRYIVSQILGAFVACFIIYLQWKGNIVAVEEALSAQGKLDAIQFTPSGPAGIFALYTTTGANLGYVLANEFFVDFTIGLVIWATLDPSNFFAPPAMAPWTIGLTYAAAIWGYAPVGLAANSARDVGARLFAMCIWGRQASGGNYAALAALTNIVSMIASATFYEIFFTDSSRVLPPAQLDFLYGHKAHEERRARDYHRTVLHDDQEQQLSNGHRNRVSAVSNYSKEAIETKE